MIKKGLDLNAIKSAGYRKIGEGTMSYVFKRPDEDQVVKVNLMPDKCWNEFISRFVAKRNDVHVPVVYKHNVIANKGYAFMEMLSPITDEKFLKGFYSFLIYDNLADFIVRMSKSSSKQDADNFKNEYADFCKTMIELNSFSKSIGCKFDLSHSSNIMRRDDVPVIVDALV
jgi:hypothetical protein